jgi:hypothetical protein
VCAQIPQPPPWGSRIGRSSLNLPMAWSSHGASIPGPPSWDLHSGLPGASVLGSLGPLLWASMLGCLGPVPNLCHPLIRHTRPLCPPGAPLCPGTRGGKEAQWTLSTGEQSEYVHPARGVLHPWSPWDPAQTLDAHQPPNQPRPQISPGPKSAQLPNQPRPQVSADAQWSLFRVLRRRGVDGEELGSRGQSSCTPGLHVWFWGLHADIPEPPLLSLCPSCPLGHFS